MSENQLHPTAQQIADRLTNIVYLLHDQLDPLERASLTEACRRIRQHERLVRDVIPDLRRQLADGKRPQTTQRANLPGSVDRQRSRTGIEPTLDRDHL